jgi:hypothetical protein
MTTEPTGNEQEITRIARSDDSLRIKIGQWIVLFALGTIGLLGLAAFGTIALISKSGTHNNESFNQVKDILGLLLPVLGTWVGTVLAFYFSKENFVAAAQQTSNLVRQLTPEQKLEVIPVEQVMLLIASPQTLKLTLSKKEEEIKLKTDILDTLLPEGSKNRLPCIDPEGKIRYILHRSLIEGFISKQALSGGSNLADLTLKDLLASDQILGIATAFGTVGQTAKLNAVKALMDGNSLCSDVFVTVDGTKNGKAIGWITNVIVAENSKI